MNARTPVQVAVDIGAFSDVPAGTTIYADNDNGDDSTGARGSQILPFKTLLAFTHALSGEVIYISPGTYDQGTTALVIPSNVTVVGSGASSSTITGSISRLTRCVVEPLTGSSIADFTLQTTATTGAAYGTGSGSSAFVDATISNCLVIGNSNGNLVEPSVGETFSDLAGPSRCPPEPRIVLLPGERWKHLGSPVTKPNAAAVELT